MRHRWMLLGICFGGLAAGVLAEESTMPVSDFRKYFWGARQAYEDRDYKKAEKLLRIYRQRGSLSDPLLKLAGCDPTWEVSVFTEALKESRTCLVERSAKPYWTDAEQAKFTVLKFLREQDVSTLEPYIDCAPADLIPISTTCGVHSYRKPADIERLGAAILKTPDILNQAAWREFPAKPDDPQNVRWMLYPTSVHWKPCGMAGTPLISLRQDPTGQIRIAGFAASCLEPTP